MFIGVFLVSDGAGNEVTNRKARFRRRTFHEPNLIRTRTTTWNLPGPSGTRDYIDIVKPVVLKNPSK